MYPLSWHLRFEKEEKFLRAGRRKQGRSPRSHHNARVLLPLLPPRRARGHSWCPRPIHLHGGGARRRAGGSGGRRGARASLRLIAVSPPRPAPAPAPSAAGQPRRRSSGRRCGAPGTLCRGGVSASLRSPRILCRERQHKPCRCGLQPRVCGDAQKNERCPLSQRSGHDKSTRIR